MNYDISSFVLGGLFANILWVVWLIFRFKLWINSKKLKGYEKKEI